MSAIELRPILITRLTRFTRSRSLAEDIVDEAYLRLVRLGEHRANMWPWLMSVSWNILKDFRKHQSVQVRNAMPICLMERTNSPVQDVMDSELLEALDHALLILPDHERDSFSACKLDGMTATEASVALGISECMVKTNVFRARRRLRQWLRRFDRQPPSNLH